MTIIIVHLFAGYVNCHIRLLDLAHDVFAEWQQTMAAGLRRDGLTQAHARRLAALIVAAIEGTVAMCHATRSTDALDDIAEELQRVLAAALGR